MIFGKEQLHFLEAEMATEFSVTTYHHSTSLVPPLRYAYAYLRHLFDASVELSNRIKCISHSVGADETDGKRATPARARRRDFIAIVGEPLQWGKRWNRGSIWPVLKLAECRTRQIVICQVEIRSPKVLLQRPSGD